MEIPKPDTIAPSDKDISIRALTLAFSSDPVMRWIWKEPMRYLDFFPRLVPKMAGQAFERNTASHVENYACVSLWLPPGVQTDDAQMVAFMEEALLPEQAEPMFEVLGRMEEYHPKEDHWYLSFLGADPAFQGKGLGSVLLKHDLKRCDEDNMIAYLESSNLRNVPFYQRHGFEAIGTVQVGDSPTLTFMLREPRS